MVVMVISNVESSNQRSAIRNAWAAGHDNVYFVVGWPNDDELLDLLEAESQQYKDVVIVNATDEERSLKLYQGLTWLYHQNTNATWFVKSNDDMVVRIDRLQRFLFNADDASLLSKQQEGGLSVIGHIVQEGSSPVHKSGPYADVDFNASVYPAWPRGSCGYVMNRHVVQFLIQQTNPFLSQSEDTSVGIWLDDTSAEFVNEPDKFIMTGNCQNQDALIIGYGMSAETIVECFKLQTQDEIIQPKRQRPVTSRTPSSNNAIAKMEEAKVSYPLPADWIQPTWNSTSTLMVLVLSARDNYNRRQAIRDTWKADNVYFVVGLACDVPKLEREADKCKVREKKPSWFDFGQQEQQQHSPFDTKQQQRPKTKRKRARQFDRLQTRRLDDDYDDKPSLEQEQLEHGDILLVPVKESYRALPHKVRHSMDWIVNITDAQWIFKADDDQYLKVDEMEHYLQQFNHSKPTVVGQVIPKSRVARQGKWAETRYPNLFYPPWPRGASGYAISRPIAYYIQRQDKLFISQGEDTSMGIWLDTSPFRTNVQWVNSKHFTYWAECKNETMIAIGHDLTPDQLHECHDVIQQQPKPSWRM